MIEEGGKHFVRNEMLQMAILQPKLAILDEKLDCMAILWRCTLSMISSEAKLSN
jgi:Fe-S cluster assembly ATPase SufC